MLKQFDDVLSYIEEQLKGEILQEEIAKRSCCTFPAFQKMFSYIVGIPLSLYIRRRKMSAAVFDLLEGQSIVALSEVYGYQSPTAFNRAFQSIHGFPPSEVKQKKNELVSYPRLHLSLAVSGEASIRYRIEEKKAMVFVGKRYRLNREVEENFQQVPTFWHDFQRTEQYSQLRDSDCGIDEFIYGVAVAKAGVPDSYYIGLSVKEERTLPVNEMICIPKQTWVVFSGEGAMPETMQQMYRTFYREWLPAADYDYEITVGDIEVYPLKQESLEAEKCELWLPIKRKTRAYQLFY